MAKQQSTSPVSKKSSQPPSGAFLPLSLQNLSDEEVKAVQPLLTVLKDPTSAKEKVLELLQQPKELKSLAVDIFLIRALLVDETKGSSSQSASTLTKSKTPKLSEDQKERINARLLKLRENSELSQEERIKKTWGEFSKKIPELSIWQVRAYDAHITMRSNSGLS